MILNVRCLKSILSFVVVLQSFVVVLQYKYINLSLYTYNDIGHYVLIVSVLLLVYINELDMCYTI